MIEQTIYDRLQPVTANVYPDTPTENTGLPFVVYRVSGTEAQLHTQGVSAITKYTVEVDTYAENKAEVSALQGSLRTQLHGYRGGQIQGAFLQSESGEEIELGYHGQQTFVIWSSTANVTATTDSTGSVQTGPNSVSLSACEHTLTLDCDGLRLDGGPVGQTPDLSAYARVDSANTFEAAQYLTGENGTALVVNVPSDSINGIDFVEEGEVKTRIECSAEAGAALTIDTADRITLTTNAVVLNSTNVGFFGNTPRPQPVFNGDWLGDLDAPTRQGFDQLLAGLFALGLFRDELA